MAETQPLLGVLAAPFDAVAEGAESNNIVDFDPSGDDNPVNWPAAYKWSVVALLAFMAFTVQVVTFTCICVVPVANHIVSDLDHGRTSKTASVLLVTVWELGEAAGPLLIAPASELFGRYPVMNAANILFISAIVLAALCQSTSLFITARALTGLAVASNVLNPAIVGDMFVAEQRGSPMSLIMLAPLIGAAVGPAISGAVSETLGWRAVMWMSVLLATVSEITFLTCFRETYKVRILRQKAAGLRKLTGNAALKTEFDEDDVKGSAKLREAFLRPALVLYGSGVLQLVSLFGSVLFAYFYIMSTTLPDILESIYGLSPALIGSAFVFNSLGSAISVVILNQFLDRIFIALRDSHKGVAQPEYRLPLSFIGGVTLPVVIAFYGWAAQKHAPLPVMLLSVGLQGTTLILAIVPLMSYVVDAFGLYSASALTATIVCRCLMGTFLPMVVAPLVRLLDYGPGFMVLAAVSMCLAPIPLLILRYGPKWRQRSKYTKGDE